MKILVIGSNSVSGSSVISGLIREGHSVTGISRSKEYSDVFLPYKWPKGKILTEAFKFIQLDINRNINRFEDLVNSLRPEVVINFAAQGMVAQSWEQPSHWYNTNLVGLVAVTEVLTKQRTIKLFIQASTPEVYGDTADEWISEDTPLAGSTPYAISKAAFDHHLCGLQKLGRLPVVLTRAANVYGPGQALYRLIPRLIIGFKTGKGFVLEGKGASIRSFVHTHDLTDAYLRIVNLMPIGNTYHISTGEFLSIRDLVVEVCTLLGVEFERLVNYGPERLAQDKAYLLSTSKIREELRWKDNMPLKEGLESVSEWIAINYDYLSASNWSYSHKP